MNGAGKSTLFKAIMGFVPAASGSIKILDLPVKKALQNNIVAYVPQSEEVDWSFPVLVEDVVMMGRYGHMGFLRLPSAADQAQVETALDRVGMADFSKTANWRAFRRAAQAGLPCTGRLHKMVR